MSINARSAKGSKRAAGINISTDPLLRIATATGTGSPAPSQTTPSLNAGLSASIVSTRCRRASIAGSGIGSPVASRAASSFFAVTGVTDVTGEQRRGLDTAIAAGSSQPVIPYSVASSPASASSAKRPAVRLSWPSPPSAENIGNALRRSSGSQKSRRSRVSFSRKSTIRFRFQPSRQPYLRQG